MGVAWFNFNPRFYIVALIYIIFDVEVAFILPVATVYRRWVVQGMGSLALAEIAAFVGILLLGLVYVWRKGDLEWIRTIKSDARAKAAPTLRAVVGDVQSAVDPKPVLASHVFASADQGAR